MTTLRVAVLQASAPDFGRAESAWADLLARIDDAAQDEPDLIVLPEASYPAWFLGTAAGTTPVLPDSQVVGELAERARRHGVHIAAGLVLGRPGGAQNVAVLLSPEGVELARASEARPAPWFTPGRGPAAASIAGASVALFAGADHLDPRWVEAIADARTQLCIATGAARGWSAPNGGAVIGDPSGFVIPTRAAETGAWFVVAGRTGVEADSVGYAGGAGVASPRDGWVARAPEDRPGIVLHACELAPVQPGLTASPDARGPSEILRGTGGLTRVAALALDPSPSVVDLMESVRASVRAAATLGAQLILLPDLTGADPRAVSRAEVLPLIEDVSAETHTLVIAAAAERADGGLYRSVSVVEDGRLLTTYRQTSLVEADVAAGFLAGSGVAPLVRTERAGILGLLAGREALQPGAASLLRRGGAQVIAWCAGHADPAVAALAQTRAWEQRLPVVAAGGAASGACVVAEGGTLLAATRPGTPMLTHASIDRRAST